MPAPASAAADPTGPFTTEGCRRAAGDLHGKSLATVFLIVLGATLSTYRIFWKPTGIADRVESATTVHKTLSAAAAAPTAATG